MYNSELSADNGSSPQFRNTIDRTVAIHSPPRRAATSQLPPSRNRKEKKALGKFPRD